MYQQSFLARLQDGLRRALSHWSLSPDTAIALLSISENATYLLDDPQSGTRLVVRVHRPGYHTEAEIASELDWIEALRAARAVDTPAPIPTRNGERICRLDIGGETRPAVAFTHAPGVAPQQDDDLPGWFHILGAVTARLHGHAKSWTPPAGFRRKRWHYPTMLEPDGFWGDWRDGLGLDAPGRALLGRAARVLQTRLDRYGTGPERFGLVHADLRLANLLVDASGLRVIDFDDCGFCWYAYDFAAAISFFEDDPVVPALLEAWIAGYRTVAPFAPADAAEMQSFILLRRILLVAWIASHAETPTAQEMGVRYTEASYPLAERYLSEFS